MKPLVAALLALGLALLQGAAAARQLQQGGPGPSDVDVDDEPKWTKHPRTTREVRASPQLASTPKPRLPARLRPAAAQRAFGEVARRVAGALRTVVEGGDPRIARWRRGRRRPRNNRPTRPGRASPAHPPPCSSSSQLSFLLSSPHNQRLPTFCPAQALVQFAAGATPAQHGRALALGQAQEASEMAPGLVLVKFGPASGRSTGKAAKRVEQDPAVTFAEARAAVLGVETTHCRALACAVHHIESMHRLRPCPAFQPAAGALSFYCPARWRRASWQLRARSDRLELACCPAFPRRSPVFPQPNFIDTRVQVSNDPGYTGGNLWGM